MVRRNRFYTGKFDEETGVKDVTWITAGGTEARDEDWGDGRKCIGMLMDGRAQVHTVPQDGDHSTLLLILNAHHGPVDFTLPPAADGHEWGLVLDTTDTGKIAERFGIGATCLVSARSLLLFILGTHSPAPIPDESKAAVGSGS